MIPTQSGVKHVKFTYLLENLLLYFRAWFRQTKFVVIMTKEESTKSVNLITPGVGDLVLGRGHISHTVKMHCFFENLFQHSQARIRQTWYIIIMYQNCQLYDPRGRGSCATV